jgi:hypothetical protein
MSSMYEVGDPVWKTGGDYSFKGEVRGVIYKKSGAIRYVVEDDRGLLLILDAGQLISRERSKDESA